MNKVHLPMELTQREKNLVIDYLRRYKHSPLSIKMLLCAYSGSPYRNGYINFESYLVPSINAVSCYGDSRLYSTRDECLIDSWHMDRNWKTRFFGFDRDTIMEGTIGDVETMVSEVYSRYINEKNDTQTFTNGVH